MMSKVIVFGDKRLCSRLIIFDAFLLSDKNLFLKKIVKKNNIITIFGFINMNRNKNNFEKYF